MVKVDPADCSGRSKGGPKSFGTWLVTCLLVLLLGVFLLVAVGTLAGDVEYLAYLASEATVFDAWGVLTIISALLSLTAIAAAIFAARRRRLVLAIVVSLLALPTSFVIEGSRCDTAAACRLMGWAALPQSAFAWSARIRSVTDPNEARNIASAALSKADAEGSPFKAKRFADHWIVSTIDHDGWPGAYAVRIDTRTADTRLLACPADRIQCGMERPTVADGRRVYRDDRVGVAAIFPASRAVCTSRSDDDDDEPRGFFAMVRAPDIPCEIIDQSRQMGVEISRHRMTGCAVTEAPSLPWQPLSPGTASLFRRPPTLGGRPSMACELHMNGFIQVSVYASAASRSAPGGTAGSRYEGYIVTTPAHLAEDVRAFETFLERVQLGTSG